MGKIQLQIPLSSHCRACLQYRFSPPPALDDGQQPWLNDLTLFPGVRDAVRQIGCRFSQSPAWTVAKLKLITCVTTTATSHPPIRTLGSVVFFLNPSELMEIDGHCAYQVSRCGGVTSRRLHMALGNRFMVILWGGGTPWQIEFRVIFWGRPWPAMALGVRFVWGSFF